MTMNQSNPIVGITLEGFQVFDKPTYVPLDGLTLLFGPNSAGKSAVQDAIELYAILLSDDAHYTGTYIHPDVFELLKRHWRRSGDCGDQWADRLGLRVIHTTQCDIHSSFGDSLGRKVWGDFLAQNAEAWQLESCWLFQRDGEGVDLSCVSCFEFYIEKKLLVRYNNTELGINLTHPLLMQTELKVDFAEVARTYPTQVLLNDGYLSIRAWLSGFHPRGISTIEMLDESLLERNTLSSKDSATQSQDKSLLRTAIAEINDLFRFLSIATGNSRFKPSVVEASRKVPTRSELFFQFGDLSDQIEPLLPQLNQSYSRLAGSIAHLPTAVGIEAIWNTDRVSDYGERVNRALSDHLFIEQGYYIDHDFRVLMSKGNSLAAVSGAKLDPKEFGYVVELFLRDGKQRKHLFEDVGSGIGYVLPVLCAVFESNAISATCFIQQPELHIHPALQSAIGDVFVEASSKGKQILIETHSEHLLLRILKRIRQTHLQAAIAPELKINADDVCVLYFDPSPDGTTTVKRLRITEDGEFMDRWPRGFFAERDQELLDE